MIVVGSDGLSGKNVEDLLGDVLVGVLLHGVDINMLDLAIVALFGVAHDVVGDQHHGIPGPDPLEHAGIARLLVVEVIGEVPLLGQILAQQAPRVDVQRFRDLDTPITDIGQDADAAGEDGIEHEVLPEGEVFLLF